MPGVGNIETPPGWHGLRYAALSGMDPRQCRTHAPLLPYYNRAAVLACAASGVAVVFGIGCGASGRWQTLQRGAGGIIAVCVGLVSAVLGWGKSQENPMQSPVCCFAAWVV